MKELDRLKGHKPTPKSIFRFSPYEVNENLHRTIPYKYWEDKILSKTEYYLEVADRLENNLLKDQILISLFCGFSGNGKTTFLKWFFERNRTTFDNVYINVANAPRIAANLDVSPAVSNDRITKSIISELKKILNNDYVRFTELLTILENNQFFLQNYFISKVEDLGVEKNKNKIAAKLDLLPFNDSLILFLLYNIYIFKFNDFEKIVICFDNLDDLSLIYLSEKFIDQFTKVITSMSHITQEIINFDIFFATCFRFIFVLREGTFAELSSHVRDFIEQGYFNKIDFKLQVSDKEIIQKRLRLIEKVCPKNVLDEKKNILDIIRSFNDDNNYSRKVFLPLFNFDTRKLITYLLRLGDSTVANKPLRLDRYFLVMDKSKFGGRGIIYRGLFNVLWERDYLAAFADPVVGFDPKLGFCNPSRVILTCLLNQCNYKSSYVRGNEYLFIEKTNLFRVLRSLKGIYSDELIIDTVKRFFYGHRTSWSHLLTIYNKNCEIDRDFLIEKEAIKTVRGFEEQAIFYGTEFKKAAQVLEKVGLQINPSGFICLRHLITHFEYYSKLVNFPTPLFNCTKLEKHDDGKFKFEFEECLNAVKERVQSHVILMNKYYKSTVARYSNYSFDKFNLSELAIKHYNFKNNPQIEESRPDGYFHSTRLLNRHIDYIDNFRMFLLHDSKDFQGTLERISKLQPDRDKIFVNKYIVNVIEFYVELIAESIDEKAKQRFLEIYSGNIEAIKKKDYRDFNRRISEKID